MCKAEHSLQVKTSKRKDKKSCIGRNSLESSDLRNSNVCLDYKNGTINKIIVAEFYYCKVRLKKSRTRNTLDETLYGINTKCSSVQVGIYLQTK